MSLTVQSSNNFRKSAENSKSQAAILSHTMVDPFTSQPLGLNTDGNGEFVGYWRSIRKRLWSVLLFAAAVTAVGVVLVNAQVPIYRSTASVMVEGGGPPKVAKLEDRIVEASPYGDNLQTQIEVLKSRNVVLRTVRELRLWEDPVFDPRRALPAWSVRLQEWLGMSGPEVVTWTEDKLAEAVAARVSARVETEIVAYSRLIRVSFNASDPELAARVVNTLVDVYIAEDREARFRATQSLNSWLEQRALELQQNVARSEQALQAFREKNNLVRVGSATQALSTRQMEELMPQVVTARVRVAELESAYQQVKNVRDGDYSSVPWVLNAGGVVDARARETTARLKVAELSQNYGFEHPRMVQANGELAEARAHLKRQIDGAVGSLTREYETARATLRALEQAVAGERDRTQKVNRIEFELQELERDVASNRQMYELFMNRAKEMDIGAGIEQVVARVIDRAVAVATPIKPDKPKLIFAAVLIGLVGGVVIALALDLLDNTIKGADDAERRLGLPVLSSLPILAPQNGEEAARHVAFNVSSLFSEGVRTARTGLLLSTLDDESRVFMVTSSVPGEGKTTVAANLAQALAQSGPTVLIEADLRKPTLTAGLGLDKGAKGLSELVMGEAGLDECAHTVEGSSLRVIPAGTLPPNPLELLSSRRFEAVVAQCRERFGNVVIDTPPVEVVSDAFAVSRVSSGVVFVVRAGETAFPLVYKGLMRLHRANANVIGLVINRVDFAKAQKYYGEYSGYGRKGYAEYAYRRS